jgi:hypothetical protein
LTIPWLLIVILWGIIPEIGYGDTIRVFFALDTPQHEFAAGDIKTAL